MVPTLRLCKRFRKSGSYGLYYRLNKKQGIKVCKDTFSNIEKDYIESLESDFYENGVIHGKLAFVAEYVFMKILKPIASVPTPYSLTWVNRPKGKSLAIVMEHIHGLSFDELDMSIDVNHKEFYDFEKAFNTKAKKVGLRIYDWRFENVIKSKTGKIYRVDFSSRFIDVMKRKKEFITNFKEECVKLLNSL